MKVGRSEAFNRTPFPMTWLLPEWPFSVIMAFVVKSMASVRRHGWNCLKANSRSRCASQVPAEAYLFQRNQIAEGIDGIRVAAGLHPLIFFNSFAPHQPPASFQQSPSA